MVMSGHSTRETAHALDDNVQDFVQNQLDSLVKWDLIRFFHDNPHTSDTADKIAGYTGREVATIERELKGLVAAGVVQAREVAGLTIYQLSVDEGIRRTVHHFMEACHDRGFRNRAIHHVIQRMQSARRL